MAAPLLSTGAAESVSAPGTGAFTLLGPATSVRRRFRDDVRVTSGRQVYYACTDGTQTEWGVGTLTIGTNGVSDTLSRDVIVITTAGASTALNFTGNATVYSSDQGLSHPMKDLSGNAYSGIANDQLLRTDATFTLVRNSIGDQNNIATTGDTDSTMTQVGAGIYVTATTPRLVIDFSALFYLDGGNYTVQATDNVLAKARITLWNSAKTTIIDHWDGRASLTQGNYVNLNVPFSYSGLSTGTQYLLVISTSILGTNNTAARFAFTNGSYRMFQF